MRSDITPEALRWIGEAVDGDVVRAEPFLHTRPMWTVDVRLASGPTLELFVRGDRGAASALAAVYNLEREARIVQALTRVGVPTPSYVAFSPELKLLVLERVGGESNFVDLPDGDRRSGVATSFIETIAALHTIPAAEFGLEALGIPQNAEEMALTELRIGEALFAASGCPSEPVVDRCREWLYASVPDLDEEASFLQGDTGPGNFMFEGERVTYLVDWEIAHFGDPLEDLAAVCVRDMVTPFAHLPTLFARYTAVRRRPVDLTRLRYHRVSKCVRSLFAILTYCRQHDDPTWWGWRARYLAAAEQALTEAQTGQPAPGPFNPID